MKKAFTLSEVLVTLGIIGVVAALTLPVLVTKYQQKQVVEQLKKVYATLEQAFKLSEYENGFADEWVEHGSTTVNNEVMSKYFDTYWRPYLKIIKTCDSYSDCGYSKSYFYDINNQNSGALIADKSTRIAVILNDGTLLSFVPMNWYSADSPYMSKIQQIRVDLNGPRGKNRYGRDVFNFVIDLEKHFIKPLGYDKQGNDCNRNPSSAGQQCLKRIIEAGWQIKGSDYPW